jgi:psiF repeat-containing protein
MWKFLTVLGLALSLSFGSAAVAQMKEKESAKARSAASLECSKQADEKGLHGKARKTFRSKCMKDMKKT